MNVHQYRWNPGPAFTLEVIEHVPDPGGEDVVTDIENMFRLEMAARRWGLTRLDPNAPAHKPVYVSPSNLWMRAETARTVFG